MACEGDITLLRILIAEDDAVLGAALAAALRSDTQVVEHVVDGAQADTALSAADRYDLLILDLGLPRLHGLDVLTRLRARGSHLPVLILTAAGCTTHCHNGLALGANACLAKPFAVPELLACVQGLMPLCELLPDQTLV